MFNNRWKDLRTVMLLCILALLVGTATAQDAAQGSNLVYSVASEGELNDTTFAQTWTLQTASADRLTIRVERLDGNLIPEVTLLDSNNQRIRAAGSDATGAVAIIPNLTLTAGGDYQVVVQRKDAETGLTSGKYSVTVTPLATAKDNPNNAIVISEITPGVPVSGEITPARWYQRYSFTAQGKDVIRIIARRTEGTLFPQVEILDSNDASLRKGPVENTGEFAQINNFELPSAGTYTIVATRASEFNGATVGTYSLQVDLIGAGEDNPMMAGTLGSIQYDAPVTGEIGSQWYQDWQLTPLAGDIITLSVERTSGSLQPEVWLLGGNGQQLQRRGTDETGAAALVDHYKLSGAGSFTVRVTRVGGKNGATSGGYNLTVKLEATGTDSPTLQQPVGSITDGTPVEGELTAAQWVAVWTYTGVKGTVIDIHAERTDGTLIPRVDIRDSNGLSLRAGRADRTLDTAEIIRYTLPGDGEYQIAVLREGEHNGLTTGKYTLTVSPSAS